jgi:hypothetical protein
MRVINFFSYFKTYSIKKILLFLITIAVLSFLGYQIGRNSQWFFAMREKMSASLPVSPAPSPISSPPTEVTPEVKTLVTSYTEKAQKGEGLTHLARRVLSKYLKDHAQSFQLRPEHKIYIEDYLAKEMGYRWLQLGEEITFSADLIQRAINQAQNLTPAQIQNLSQYVPLVPSLS